MRKHCIWILDVRRAAWHTKFDDEVSLHFNAFCFLSVQLNPLHAVLHIQNIAEKENINVEKMLFTSKLKPRHSHRMHIYCI